MILNSEDEYIRSELIALGINLAVNNKNAQLIVENNRLQGLIKIAFRNQDALVMKMIRNISQHNSTKENFVVSRNINVRISTISINHRNWLILFDRNLSAILPWP